MKLNIIVSMGAAALSLFMIGCGAPAANTANAKPANAAANTAANTAAANTAAAAPKADGDVLKIDEAGLQMLVPKGFKFAKDGEDTVVTTDDGGVDIRFTVPKDGDYDTIVDDAVEEMGNYLTDIKTSGDTQKRNLNGMETTELTGSAKTKAGEDVLWNLTIINAKRPVLINIYAEKGSLEKSGAEVKAFIASVKKQ